MAKYIMALDAGTTSSRCIIFDHGGHIKASAQQEFRQYYPHPGWVEHNADEIWETQLAVIRQAMEKSRLSAPQISAIGITNQRETTIVWDKTTGKPVCPAIVWQCRRTAEYCDELGVRFPDMSQIYDLDLQRIVRRSALDLGIDIKEGTYMQFTGPQYETPQEISMARTLGADAVGMSTACEAIAARHMGMRVLGISCITNLASGISPNPLSHKEVQEIADAVAPKFKALVTEIIKAAGAE